MGVRHALWVYAAPSAVFRRIEDNASYGWALFVLLVLVTLIGYAQVRTGLIDREVDQRTEERLAYVEKTQADLIERGELREQIDAIRKGGEFEKLMTRMAAVVAAPVYMLSSVLLIASGLYMAVALTGRKPEYHTLVSICVYAEFIELAAYLLRLAMMLYYRTIEVDTTLSVLARSKVLVPLEAIDPFRLWFWVLVGMGVAITQQLSRRMAVIAVVLMCVSAIGARVAMKIYLPTWMN